MANNSSSPQAKTSATSRIDNQVYKIFPNDLNAKKTVFGGLPWWLPSDIAAKRV